MNITKEELKARLKLVDDRIPVLLKKYPVVSFFMLVVPLVIGLIIGAIWL